MTLTEEQLAKLKDAKLEWGKAFIDSPCSKRCLCIPFNEELNQTYEEGIRLEQALNRLPSLNYELSSYGKAMAKFHAEVFHQLPYGRNPELLNKLFYEAMEEYDNYIRSTKG